MRTRADEIDSAWIRWAMRQPKKKVVIDLGSDENMGGNWLNSYRAARELARRLAVKAARKTKSKGGAQG